MESRPPTVVLLPRRLNSAHSSTTSLSSENRRVPGIRYPSVNVDSSRNSSPLLNGSGMQALQSSGAIDRLREENARLRLRTEEITTDSNRRVEMHVAEIRMLKEETKRLRGSIGQIEEERNKARQLAHEWHKFARYSSDLVKQEVRGYDGKLKEASVRIRQLRQENEELRQICLYLDEQRQSTSAASRRLSARSEESDDQGCGSSDHSMEGGEGGYCIQKEDSLRRICLRDGGEEEGDKGGGGEQGLANDRLLSYIHSLENRIKHLEITTTTGVEDSWRSSITPETDDLTVMEREWEGRERRGEERLQNGLGQSTCTMTSSGTTFCSSEMDESMMTSSSVFVDGSEPGYSHLEVRTLPPIEEERKDDLSQSTNEGKRLSAEVALSALLPPCMEPISSTTMNRYRIPSEMSMRVSDETLSLRREPRSVSEAVDTLRMREQREKADTSYGRWSSDEHTYLSAL